MLKFIKSHHFIIRAKERNIPTNVNEIRLKKCGSSTKKKIKICCKRMGFNNDYVYFKANINNMTVVYICIQIDIAIFKIITAFNIRNFKID